MIRTLLVLVLLASSLTPTFAGIADSPLPLLNGEKAAHVFTVPGVTHVTGLGTVFFCASTEKTKNVTIGIEVFNFNGTLLNDVATGNGVLTVTPGKSVTFKTESGGVVAAFPSPAFVSLSTIAEQGSARILATSKNIVCSALIASLAGQPPTSMASLSVISKVKQKGD